MATKKEKKQTINNIQELNLEIDYDKLAEAIVRANFLQQEEFKKQEEEKRKSNRMQALKNMKIEKYYDENGKPIKRLKKRHNCMIFLKFLFTKDKNWALLSNTTDNDLDLGAFPSSINAIVYSLFLLAEWGLYLLSGGLLIHTVAQIVINYLQEPWYILFLKSTFFILSSFTCFLLGRGYVRLLKIDCEHSNDKHYMINFLALVVSVVAIIVAIIVR
jgi:hypothetical protein